MSVYGEVLFIENAVSGAVILILTGKLCGSGRSAAAVTAGSICCGIYAFILFVPLPVCLSLLSKLIFSGAIVAAVFRPESVRKFVKETGCFYVVSFLMGGVTIALMYMTKVPGLSGNGAVYIGSAGYMNVICGIGMTFVAGTWLSEYLKEKRSREVLITELEIHIGASAWSVKAFVDTGNFLEDPVTGRPVVLIDPSVGKEMFALPHEETVTRICVIPYEGIGGKGLLQGLRPDYIIAGGERIERIVIAVNAAGFRPWKGEHRYQALIGAQVYEGRICKDVK